MNKHQELAIIALENMMEDRVSYLKHSFAMFTAEQMQLPYGNTTRAQVLSDAEAQDEEIKAAIKWVENAT